jgi:type II secretory pathway pseudopilin PulG
MLVAVTLFSIVLMICLGSIMTIVDVNRKSQTLTTVMNDLSFSLENMTRSIKTGQIDNTQLAAVDASSFEDFNALTVVNQDGEEIEYKLVSGAIVEDNIPITSEQVTISELRFRIFYGDANRQPRVLMVVSGTASTSQSISSDFTIQTTVSQRDLETGNFGDSN